MRAVLAARPDLTLAQLQRTRDLMDRAVPDCLISGHEGLIAQLNLPDENDRHVLAAAIRAQAGVIVTFNSKDFPAAALAPYNIEIQHPDEFISHLFDLSPAQVTKAVRDQRAALKSPPKSARELLDILLTNGLASTVASLETMIELL
ncbi:MAG: PIN domain-containing protein [Steroidobacter sp.]|nr:PIN domain-containing protein [Steroidobacter sp.]MBL8270505.1 PIN domain-containing protein [Steroidobacter sp.]